MQGKAFFIICDILSIFSMQIWASSFLPNEAAIKVKFILKKLCRMCVDLKERCVISIVL